MNRLTDRQSARAARYWPLARAYSDRLTGCFPRIAEELHAAVVFGLIEAAGSYPEGAPFSFATHAKRVIAWRVKSARKNATRPKRDPARAGPFFLDLHDRPAPESAPETPPDLSAIIAGLPPRDRRLVLLVYQDGMRQGRAAAALGYSKQNACTRLKQSLGRLRTSPRVRGVAGRP